MSSALLVYTNELLCDVYGVQCVRNRLMTMQAEAVYTILHDASKEHRLELFKKSHKIFRRKTTKRNI